MTTFQDWAEVFVIFSKYSLPNEEAQVAVEHDTIYAGPSNTENISQEDINRLSDFGWHYDADFNCFYKNV